MSKAFNDPTLLTKDRLKKELEENGVKIPRGEQKKEFYVKLYRENLSPQAGQNSGHGEFSSDDDDVDDSLRNKQIVPRASRIIKKLGSKEIVSADIKSMTDEELKQELSSMGSPVGPIMPSTRGLYERKLARMRDNLPSNGTTVKTITKSEFSDDNDFEDEVQDEESVPDDEFFYKRQGNSRSGANFGSTFTKNFTDTSSKKEVTRDFSMSSSRNVEQSSTFDRKTTNKVRTKKGDKFEEKNWSTGTSTSNEKGHDDEDGAGNEVLQLPGLPSSIQKALTAARITPEKSPEPATETRSRSSVRQHQRSEIPEDIPDRKISEEKPKKSKPQKTSSKWRWVKLIAFLILIIFAVAVVYNMEEYPALPLNIEQLRASLAGTSDPQKNSTQE